MTFDFGSSQRRRKELQRRLVEVRANVLIIGTGHALDSLLTELRRDLREPVACVPPGGLLPSGTPQTLIIMGLDVLDAASQRSLAAWMDAPHRARTQIIALAERPPYARLKEGLFDAALYYRLNTICFELEQH